VLSANQGGSTMRETTHQKTELTDKFVQSLPPAPTGKRYTVWDTVLPCFGVRMTDAGYATYIVAGRPAGGSYVRQKLGRGGVIKLADARKAGSAWLIAVEAGENPKLETERKEREAKRIAQHKFSEVAEAFIAEWIIGRDPEQPRQRKHKEVTRNIRKI